MNTFNTSIAQKSFESNDSNGFNSARSLPNDTKEGKSPDSSSSSVLENLRVDIIMKNLDAGVINEIQNCFLNCDGSLLKSFPGCNITVSGSKSK